MRAGRSPICVQHAIRRLPEHWDWTVLWNPTQTRNPDIWARPKSWKAIIAKKPSLGIEDPFSARPPSHTDAHTNTHLTRTHSIPLFSPNHVLSPSRIHLLDSVFSVMAAGTVWVIIWFHQHIAIYQEIQIEYMLQTHNAPFWPLLKLFHWLLRRNSHCGNSVPYYCSQTASFRDLRLHIQQWQIIRSILTLIIIAIRNCAIVISNTTL